MKQSEELFLEIFMIKILAYILVFIAPDSANRLACFIKYILQDKSYKKNA